MKGSRMDPTLLTLFQSAEHVSIFMYPYHELDGDTLVQAGLKVQIELGSKPTENRRTVYGVGVTEQEAWDDAILQLETT